jgi:nudix-type nucleoside diphosphatase (YffH/AdpP family)
MAFASPLNKFINMSDKIKLNDIQMLSEEKFTLKNVSYNVKKKNGSWEKQTREVYDHGNGVTALLYNKSKSTIILTRQFRVGSYINGNTDGKLIETCAGILEDSTPEEGILREIEEETGYKLTEIKKVFEVYMSPGAVSELLHFFVAPYTAEQRVDKGGGLEEEQEEIEVMELPFDKAYNMIENGEIKDAKTIMLLQYAKINNLL